MHRYFVYILASKSGVLYVGMTNNLLQRLQQHKQKLTSGFTSRYNVDRLVYFEESGDPASAIQREKEIKKWRREKKVRLIESANPQWEDLGADWFEPGQSGD